MVSKIVFLPGWGFHETVWERTITALTAGQGYYEALPDLSLSERVCRSDIEALRIDGARQLAQRLPDHAVIVAWSVSGLLALELCDRFPDQCSQLILVASTPRFIADHNFFGISQKMANRFYQKIVHHVELLFEEWIRTVAFPFLPQSLGVDLKQYLLSRSHQECLMAYLMLLITSDLRPLYRRIKQPILVLLGERDPIVSAEIASALNTLSPCSTVHVIEGAGHAPFLTHSRLFLTRLLLFIEKNNRNFNLPQKSDDRVEQ